MEGTAERIGAMFEEQRGRLSSMVEEKRKLLSNMDFYRKGLLRGNPSASSARFGAALKELREAAWGKRRQDPQRPHGKEHQS